MESSKRTDCCGFLFLGLSRAVHLPCQRCRPRPAPGPRGGQHRAGWSNTRIYPAVHHKTCSYRRPGADRSLHPARRRSTQRRHACADSAGRGIGWGPIFPRRRYRNPRSRTPTPIIIYSSIAVSRRAPGGLPRGIRGARPYDAVQKGHGQQQGEASACLAG